LTEAVTTTPDRPKRRSNGAMKRDKPRMVADDIVTANSLATHLGMTRQNVARLTAEAVIEQRGDGCYDQIGTSSTSASSTAARRERKPARPTSRSRPKSWVGHRRAALVTCPNQTC
jgi:hypothetical protein